MASDRKGRDTLGVGSQDDVAYHLRCSEMSRSADPVQAPDPDRAATSTVIVPASSGECLDARFRIDENRSAALRRRAERRAPPYRWTEFPVTCGGECEEGAPSRRDRVDHRTDRRDRREVIALPGSTDRALP